MYDIVVMCSFSKNEKYLERIENFKKNGIINVKDKKVLLIATIGTEKIENLNDGWREDIEVLVFEGPENQISPKTAHFFANFPKDIDYKWFIRVDDDSVTDIAYLADSMDSSFDYTHYIYGVTELRNELHREDEISIKNTNLTKYFNNKKHLHEKEAFIASKAAVDKVIFCEDAIKYFQERIRHKSGYCDTIFSYGAKMVNIYPFECPYISSFPLANSLALFGGYLGHIHFIAPDINKFIINIIDNKLNKKPIISSSSNKNFLLLDEENQWNPIRFIKLREDGIIIPLSNDLTYWETNKKGDIIFRTIDGIVKCTFSGIKEGVYEGIDVQFNHKRILKEVIE